MVELQSTARSRVSSWRIDTVRRGAVVAQRVCSCQKLSAVNTPFPAPILKNPAHNDLLWPTRKMKFGRRIYSSTKDPGNGKEKLDSRTSLAVRVLIALLIYCRIIGCNQEIWLLAYIDSWISPFIYINVVALPSQPFRVLPLAVRTPGSNSRSVPSRYRPNQGTRLMEVENEYAEAPSDAGISVSGFNGSGGSLPERFGDNMELTGASVIWPGYHHWCQGRTSPRLAGKSDST